jgi:predicted TIM-barrel fold metal-dependent hydrolase
VSAPDAAASAVPARRYARIDVHMHISPTAIGRTLALMDRWGIDGGVNLSGMYPGLPHHLLETQLAAAAESRGRIAVFANADFELVTRRPKDYGRAMANDLALSQRLGAVGLKIPKGFGLGYPGPDGKRLLPVDDPGLDPLFEKAGELGLPVSMHVGDPKAFWRPATPDNERYDELHAHPGWVFHGRAVPSWEELYAAFERRVARHPKTNFIGVHFGNDPEDPDRVAAMLDQHPNLYIDTAARVPEIGRQPPEKMRQFFEKYQDRILFGTDLGVGDTPEDTMYGSTGAEPSTSADEVRFFTQTWRYFETDGRQMESPTPIQGRWRINGIQLPEPILRKVYYDNAAKLLRWQPPASPAAATKK